MAEFKSTSIRFVSRASVKLGDNYFTFEAEITKQCPETFTEEEYIDAKSKLWDEVNGEVDNQIADIRSMLQNRKK